MKILRVAFIVRNTFNTVRGGDTVQAKMTARSLRKLGVEVDIFRAADKISFGNYDLLHLFNLSRPADHLSHVAESGLPYVISTIYLDYSGFDTRGRSKLAGQIFRLTGKYRAEYLKTLFRSARGQDRMISPGYMLGHRRSMRKLLLGASLVLPNSASEYSRICMDFNLHKDFRIIPNGVDPAIFNHLRNVERRSDQVLCVGMIYGMKNQHRLIQATRQLGVKLIIIGKAPPNHGKYYTFCRSIAHSHVEFKGFLPQQQLARYYAGAKVHALPSWFETTGLTSLEAGAMGCNLVVGTGGDTHEYFSRHASFCQAEDDKALLLALEQELNRPSSLSFRDHIMTHYTWEAAAGKTKSAYLHALGIEE
jgi:glycosyltransferase involved in cell wall biosynthesis